MAGINLSIARMAPISKELAGVREELKRIADCFEMLLAENGLHVKKHLPDTSGDEPVALYTDEIQDWVRELERIKKGDEEPE